MISSNPGLLTRGTGPLYSQMLTAKTGPFQARKLVSSYAQAGQGCLGSKLIHWLKRPDEGASTAIMTYRHPALSWRKERLCCEYVLSLPSSELPLKLVSGPTAPYNRGEPRISALVLLGSPGSGHCRSGRCGQRPWAVRGHCETSLPGLTRNSLKLFGQVGPSSCVAAVRAGRRMVRACTPRCHKQQQTSTPSQLTLHKSALFYFRRFVADYACTPLLSRDHHQHQLPVRDTKLNSV